MVAQPSPATDVADAPPKPPALANGCRGGVPVYCRTDFGGVSQSRMECLQSIANLRRCSPYWYPLAIHPLHFECPSCARHVPVYYFAIFDGLLMCACCHAFEAHAAWQRWLDYEDPDRKVERFSYWPSESLRAQDTLEARDEALEEFNLSEDTNDLRSEISQFNKTGELAIPKEIATVDLHFPKRKNDPDLSEDDPLPD